MNTPTTNPEEQIRFAVQEKIPHQNDMLLINGIAYKEANTINLSMPIPTTGIFVDGNGFLSPLAEIEMIAQLCGAQFIYDKQLPNGQLCGFLAGIDNVLFHNPVKAGDELALRAWNILEMADIQRVRGELSCGDVRVGQNELTLYKMENWQEVPNTPPVTLQETPPPARECFLHDKSKDRVGQELLQAIHWLKPATPEENLVHAGVYLEPGFIGFSGHFPGFPVLPAVISLYLGFLLVEQHLQLSCRLVWVRRAKFTGPIFPGNTIHMQVKPLPAETGTTSATVLCYQVTILRAGTTVASYRLGLQADQVRE